MPDGFVVQQLPGDYERIVETAALVGAMGDRYAPEVGIDIPQWNPYGPGVLSTAYWVEILVWFRRMVEATGEKDVANMARMHEGGHADKFFEQTYDGSMVGKGIERAQAERISL